jgi:hypothetical protein
MPPMSAMPPTTDKLWRGRNGREVPVSRLMHRSNQPLYSITSSARRKTAWFSSSSSDFIVVLLGHVAAAEDGLHLNEIRIADCHGRLLRIPTRSIQAIFEVR